MSGRPIAEDGGRPRAPEDPFDPDFLAALDAEVFEPVLAHYFRPKLIGSENIPQEGPVILAPNHSGNAFPWDGMIFDILLWRRDGRRPEAKFRSVFEKELALTWWMRPFGIDNFWRRGGGVDLTFENFHRLLAQGERLIYYPEGVPGIGKGFFRRYQLQRFSTSFVIQAARNRAPVLPVYIINAEWGIPLSFTIAALDRLLEKYFKVPFLPLPAALIAIVFPFAWYATLPTRMVYVVGEPLDVAAMVREEGVEDLEPPNKARDGAAFRRVADRIQQDMQERLKRHVQEHGMRPFDLGSFLKEVVRAWSNGVFWRTLPTGWPISFVRFVRDRQRPPARSRLHAWLRDLDLAAFYLPFGWPLLSLTRALRKAPYGSRGIDEATRREKEGAYLWKLDERPLRSRGRSG